MALTSGAALVEQGMGHDLGLSPEGGSDTVAAHDEVHVTVISHVRAGQTRAEAQDVAEKASSDTGWAHACAHITRQSSCRLATFGWTSVRQNSKRGRELPLTPCLFSLRGPAITCRQAGRYGSDSGFESKSARCSYPRSPLFG
jgi:hypothetical protein